MGTLMQQYTNAIYLKFPATDEPDWAAYDVPLDKTELMDRQPEPDEDDPE